MINLDFGFTEEQIILRDSVRRFVREHVPEEYARKCDQEQIPPLEAFDKLAEMGWLGVAIPEQYGAPGLALSSWASLWKSLLMACSNSLYWFIGQRYTVRLHYSPMGPKRNARHICR